MKNYRPDGWINPYMGKVGGDLGNVFEAGADAMYEPAYQKGRSDEREALKAQGIYGKPTYDLEGFCMVKPDECADPYDREHFPKEPMYPNDIAEKGKTGWLIFIPEEV